MTNFQTNVSIIVENDEIEKVDSYKYLGQTVKMEDNTREEVLIRIKADCSCFGRYEDNLCDKRKTKQNKTKQKQNQKDKNKTKLPLILKKRVFNMCVLLTL